MCLRVRAAGTAAKLTPEAHTSGSIRKTDAGLEFVKIPDTALGGSGMTVAKAKPARAALWLAAVTHDALAILVFVLVVTLAALVAHALAALTIMIALTDLHNIAGSF